MAVGDLADGDVWLQFWQDSLDDDHAELARTIAVEMPVDLAGASVATMLAERHELAAAYLRGFATGLSTSPGR